MDGFEKKMLFIMGICIIIGGLLIFALIYDLMYVYPVASNKANEYCKSIGFDQHKTFDRVGLFSRQPVAIKCEYAEKYTDLGIRANE